MKTFIALAVTVLGINASASVGVFGLAAGTYKGNGVLKSEAVLVPDISFASVRSLHDGVIRAHTIAKLFGMKVAEAKADLKVVSVDAQNFRLVDLSNGKVCGKGICDGNQCTFIAKVMNGELTLKETWVPTAQGFRAINSKQNFKGLVSTYSGDFSRVSQ